MNGINSIFCNIFCFEETDFNYLYSEYGKYQIKVQKIEGVITDQKIPTILIGWSHVKSLYDNSRISKKKLEKNIFWTFSESEDLSQQRKDLDKFITKSLKEFIPNTYKSFDCAIDGNIFNDLDSIFGKEITYCYFGSNGSLYTYNKKGFFGINLNSIDFIGFNSQEFVEKIAQSFPLIFFNFDNIPDFLKNENFEIQTLENICWICSSNLLAETSLYKFSPLKSKENELVFFMSKLHENIDCKLAKDHKITSRYSKKDIINNWLSSQTIHFDDDKQLMLKYSNKRTITGRINCIDRRFNPQLLPKASEERKSIVSRYRDGKIVVFDYVSFETRLSVLLTKDQSFIDKMIEIDIHIETAKLLYDKELITKSERSTGKQVNHSIIYGIGSERLNSILKEKGINPENIKKVKKLLKPILDNSKKINDDYSKKGHIINPYNSVIYPQKEWAVYNNYVQSIAADLVIDKLFSIRKLISNFQSKFMYQVYDSFIFDIHPDELSLIEKIKKILEKGGSYRFEVECVSGNNLMECTSQKEKEEIEFVD